MSDADDRAIRAILSDQESAWTRGDADGFSKHMAPDFLATNVQGQGMSGKAVFDRQHAFIFAGVFKGSTMTQAIGTLRYLSPTVAFVETIVHVGDLTNPPPAWPLDSEGRLETRLLQVLDKSGGQWAVAAYHNTIVNHRAPPIVSA
ncbi:MAG: SgcJ/EcaC family oxidoreductase [Sphingomicrobium sp.]